MTDAEATVRSSILMGLLDIPEVAVAITPEGVPEQVMEALLNAVFAEPVRWAVKCYAEELDIKSKLEGRLYEDDKEYLDDLKKRCRLDGGQASPL